MYIRKNIKHYYDIKIQDMISNYNENCDISIQLSIINNKIILYSREFNYINEIFSIINPEKELYIYIHEFLNSNIDVVYDIISNIKVNNIICNNLEILEYIHDFDKNINLGVMDIKINDKYRKYINFIIVSNVNDINYIKSIIPNIIIYQTCDFLENNNKFFYIY